MSVKIMKCFKLSILIPSYGNAEYLKSTLESIFRNSYTNYEVIICTQGEFHLENELLSSERVKEIHLLKPSRYLSRIELFRQSTGDYVWFVDDDDEVDDNALSLINDIANISEPDCMVFTKIDVDDNVTKFISSHKGSSNKNPHPIIYGKKIALKDLICTDKYNSLCFKIFKRNLNPAWIDADIHQSEDKLLNYALYKVCNSFVKVNYPIYRYYLYRGSWARPITIERLNDSIESRKILSRYEPNYACRLLKEILRRIEDYLLSSDSIDDERIAFNLEDFDKKDISKALFSFRYFEYKEITRKKYMLVRKKRKIILFLRYIKKKFSDWASDQKKHKNRLLLLLIPLVCFSIGAPIVNFSTSSRIQDVAFKITNLTQNDGYNMVSFAKNNDSSLERPSFASEYYSLHDQFNTYSRCLETFDPLKIHGLKIVSYSDELNGEYKNLHVRSLSNISLLASPGIQITKTTEMEDGVEHDVYRNIFYKFQFKYKGLEKGDTRTTNYPRYCALRQNQVVELLRCIDEYHNDRIDEESLIGKYICVSSADEEIRFVFRIFNIIRDDADYIQDYSEALGNFIFVNDFTLGSFELNNSYMMTRNVYENYYNLKTRMNYYKSLNYRIIFGNSRESVAVNTDIQMELDKIMNTESKNDLTIYAFSLIIFMGLAVFCFLNFKKYNDYLDFSVAAIVPIIPYLIAKLMSFILNAYYAFSYLSSLVYFAFVIFYDVYLIIKIIRLYYDKKSIK